MSSPVAQRLPLGFTLIFATLFLSSVRSKLTAVVKDTKENNMRYVNKPHWQTLLSVNPLISARTAGLLHGTNFKCLLKVMECLDASHFYRLLTGVGPVCVAHAFHSTCTDEISHPFCFSFQ